MVQVYGLPMLTVFRVTVDVVIGVFAINGQ